MFCNNCGKELQDGQQFCPYCGTVFNNAPQQPAYQQPSYQQPEYQQPVYQQPMYQQSQRPENVSTGGWIAWSIITLLLCTIPGIVGLVYACGINSCATYEEQQKKISNCKVWNIIGTVLGGLYLLGSIAALAA